MEIKYFSFFSFVNPHCRFLSWREENMEKHFRLDGENIRVKLVTKQVFQCHKFLSFLTYFAAILIRITENVMKIFSIEFSCKFRNAFAKNAGINLNLNGTKSQFLLKHEIKQKKT